MAAKCGDAPSLGEPETDIVVSDNGTGVRVMNVLTISSNIAQRDDTHNGTN